MRTLKDWQDGMRDIGCTCPSIRCPVHGEPLPDIDWAMDAISESLRRLKTERIQDDEHPDTKKEP